MFIWTSFYCMNLVNKGAQVPVTDPDSYLIYKMVYNRNCNEGPGFLNIFISAIGSYWALKGWALSGVRTAKKD